MAEPPTQPDLIGSQLEKTAADLRTLAEQLGAIPPGSQTPPRNAVPAFLVVLALAALASWYLWSHWHSLLGAVAPLVWIFAAGWRWRRRLAQARERS